MNKTLASVAPLALAACLALPLAAQATEFNTLQLLNQSEFNLLAKDLGAATSTVFAAPSDAAKNRQCGNRDDKGEHLLPL